MHASQCWSLGHNGDSRLPRRQGLIVQNRGDDSPLGSAGGSGESQSGSSSEPPGNVKGVSLEGRC